MNEFDFGPRTSPLAFIAEAPASTEVAMRKPLVGPSGGVFEECVHAAGMLRQEMYTGNVCRRQISAGTELLGTKGWTEKGREEHAAFCARISDLEANVFVAMGNISLYALTGCTGIGKYRGSVLPCTVPGLEDRKVVPTYHPAATLRGKSIWKYDIVADLIRAKRESADRVMPDIGGELYTHPTLGETTDFLGECLNAGEIAHDIEVYNHHISCVSFAYQKDGRVHAICIPFYDGDKEGKSYWSLDDELCVWREIAYVLADPEVVVIGQNYVFDMAVMMLRNKLHVHPKRIEDTMVAHSIMYPDTPKGLDYLCSLYTNIPYYKDDRKLWDKLDEAQDRFWLYSAKDALATLLCWYELKEGLIADEGYMRAYRQTMDLYQPILYMQHRGMRLDVEGMKQMREKMVQARDATLDVLHSISDYPFNPASPKQCTEYFYGHKKLRPYLNKAGNPTADDDTLNRLHVRDNCMEAKVVQEWRAVNTFVTRGLAMAVDPDNRMRCSINPRGTKFGRLSTSKTIFNTGGNMQNLDHRFKTLLKPDPGYFLVEADKAGAEWVCVAYLSMNPNMLRAIHGDRSPHVITANLISGVPYALIEEEDRLLGHVTDQVVLQRAREKHFPILSKRAKFIPRNMTLRQAGKRANHGFNYDLGYRTFSIKYGMVEADARRVHTAYRMAYGLERWHRTIVEELRENGRTLYNCLGRKYRFMGTMNDELYKAAYSFKPQSSVADVVNQGIISVWNSEFMEDWEILMQVHDSAVYQVPIPDPDDVYAWGKLVTQCRQLCYKHLNPTLRAGDQEFTIGTDLKVSIENWATMQEVAVGDDPHATLKQLRDALLWPGA